MCVAAMFVWGLLALPPVSPADLGAFPPFGVVRPVWRDVAKPAYEYHRGVRDASAGSVVTCPAEAAARRAGWAAAEYRYWCWHWCDDAWHYRETAPAMTLRALENLRAMLGAEAYYAGRMPDPLPPP